MPPSLTPTPSVSSTASATAATQNGIEQIQETVQKFVSDCAPLGIHYLISPKLSSITEGEDAIQFFMLVLSHIIFENPDYGSIALEARIVTNRPAVDVDVVGSSDNFSHMM